MHARRSRAYAANTMQKRYVVVSVSAVVDVDLSIIHI